MLDAAVSQFGDAPYCFRKTDSGWKPLSFRQVREEAQAVASGLLALGLRPGGAMALIAEGSPAWIVTEYATLYAGCKCVPLSFRLLPEEIPFRINHSSSSAIFVSRISLDAVLQVYRELEGRPLLVYLDDDVDHFAARLVKTGLVLTENAEEGSGGISFAHLAEIGRKTPDARVGELAAEAREDDVATISYTSGTTGNPKGIMLTHLNYFANCRDALEAFHLPLYYRTLVILPCDHSFAHTVSIYAALLVGMALYFVDARGGSMGILRNIPVNLVETDPDFLLTVPAISGNFMKKIIAGVEEKGPFIERLFKRGIEAGVAFHGDCFTRPPLGTRLRSVIPYTLADLLVFRRIRRIFGRRIKFCIGGGALLDADQQKFFKALGVPVYQGYGLTEAAPVISANHPGSHKIGSSGRLLPNIDCRIVDDAGNDLPAGGKGQILIRGENVMKGYYRNPEETARTIKEGWLRTGDLGYIDEDGFLIVTGREKALLISDDGEKYSPEEIEEAIMAVGDLLVSQIVLYNDHRKYTTALVVPDIEAACRRFGGHARPDEVIGLMAEVLKRFRVLPELRDRFPRQWIPATFQFLTEGFSLQNGLLNSTSKVVRYKVEERYRELIESMYRPGGDTPDNDRNRAAVTELLAGHERSASSHTAMQ